MLIAHAGDLIALAPVAVVVAWLTLKNWRERRAQRRGAPDATRQDPGGS